MKFTPLFNIFCQDVDRMMRFYQAVIGWNDIPEYSSPIYRVLEQEGIQIGFNGLPAYPLLGLQQRQRHGAQKDVVTSMLSFVVESLRTVDEVAGSLEHLGGRVVQGPFATYYGHWQLVFEDPEGNIARVTCPRLPKGVVAPVVNFD